MELAFVFSNPQRSALLARVGNVTASQCANLMADSITQRISDNMIARQCLVGRDHGSMSPWGLYFAYRICQLHTPSGTTSSTSAEIVKALRDIFVKIDVRWRIAGRLFQILYIA
jgi:hypothetical protein